MTTYEHLMLTCCFGATLGIVLSGLGIMIADFISFIKKKVKAHKEKKNHQNADDNERTGNKQ